MPARRAEPVALGGGSPHDGHCSSGEPQSAQNRSPSPRDAPHCGHITTAPLYPCHVHPVTSQPWDADLSVASASSRNPATHTLLTVRPTTPNHTIECTSTRQRDFLNLSPCGQPQSKIILPRAARAECLLEVYKLLVSAGLR